MKLTKLTAIACAALIGGTSGAFAASKQWTKIGKGPSLEVAQAQCDLMAMGAERGHFAFGSPGFVIGAAIGSAIANSIRMSKVRQNCMVIQGWKQVSVAPSASLATGKRKAGKAGGVRTAEICIRRPQLCE